VSWKVNFDVVKLLAEAVRKSAIRRWVHVGTANSFGFGTLSHPGTEEDGYACGKYGLDYMDSKKAAQDFLLGEVRDKHLPVVIINPTFMIGENDSKPGTGEMILSVMAGKVPGCAKGGRCFAAVKDVAQACVNALEKGRVGQCYITGGTNLCYRDFFSLIGQVAKVRTPRLIIPTFLSVPMAAAMEGIARLRKQKPKLTVAMAKISGDGHYYSSSKAIRELEYPQTRLEEALSEAIRWYRDHGYILPRRQS
ncbi:MAG TPA: NAD-dependent epimerase/dehydratase family protein, partial [Candidatus Izemoplasmatales bacterium]|nr:NAD-dependent epimerase/dehydratase family protein [Candidatus Izemoplasmatales bacterium]